MLFLFITILNNLFDFTNIDSSPLNLYAKTLSAAAGSRGIKNLISLKQRTSTTSSQNQSTQQACLRKNQSEHAFLIRLSIHGTQRLNCFNLYSAMYTARILHEWNLEKNQVTHFTTICGNSAKTKLLSTYYFEEKNHEKEKNRENI